MLWLKLWLVPVCKYGLRIEGENGGFKKINN